MAESKKSFILYTDLKSVVEKLIIKDREDGTNNSGELFYHILEYVNGDEPEPINFIIEMAFEPIRLQLIRDLKKYDEIREKNRQNALSRWNKGEQKDSEDMQPHTTAYGRTIRNANDADTDSDTDMRESEAHAQIAESTNPDFIKFNKWIKEKAPFCSNPKNFTHQITEEEFIKLKKKYSGQQIADIVEKIENRKDLRRRYSNLYLTVNNWIKKEAENG